MSYTFTYKSIVLVIIHSRILYATLYLPNDESESVDDVNIIKDAKKRTSNRNFVLLTVYDDKVMKTYFDDRNANDVINRIINRSVKKNSDLNKLKQTTSSSERNENESDESITDPLRSYPPSVQHVLDQAEDMSQYIHSLNNWYNSRLKTVTVKDVTVKEDTVTVTEENTIKEDDECHDTNTEGNTVKVEDNVTEENTVKEDDTDTEGSTVKEEDNVTERNTVKEDDTDTEGSTVKEEDNVTEDTINGENTITEHTVNEKDTFTERNSPEKDMIQENNESKRQRKLRNSYNYANKHYGRYQKLYLRNGPNMRISSLKNTKKLKKTRNKRLRFKTNGNSKGKPRQRYRLSGIQPNNGAQNTTPVQNSTRTPTTKEGEVWIFTRPELDYKDKAKASRAETLLKEARQRIVDNIMVFLKDNMMSTMYVYHELKRIEKTHEVRDQIRKMIWVMEKPFNQKQKFAENVLRCYRNSLKETLKDSNMWDQPTKNLVQYIVQDYVNDGL